MSKFGGKATSDGTTIHQWQFHGGRTQKWIFENQGDGFYTIKSANATAAYYLGVINDEVVVNSDIVLRDDEITGGMEWNVSVTDSGAFKLTAKKGYSLGYALATTTSDATNGAKLVRGAYVNDTVYRDEWYIDDRPFVSSAAAAAGVTLAYKDGEYYYDYTTPINNLLEDAVELCSYHRCMNWAQYCEWAYSIPDFHEPDLLEYREMQLGSFLWFFDQVRDGAVWDIKLYSRWVAALPNVPRLESGVKFVFRGDVITSEDMGNIMYGYTGRATGFGEITLYWGGGVANQNSVNSDELTEPPLYGDDQNDHNNIKKGYDMFNLDYPDYPDIGYDGIPLDGWLSDIADVILGPVL